MRVLIVNTSEKTGGAAVAAHRLMDALNNHGVKAKMLVRDKLSDNLSVVGLPKSPLLRDFGMFASLGMVGTTGFCLIFLPQFFAGSDPVFLKVTNRPGCFQQIGEIYLSGIGFAILRFHTGLQICNQL